MALSISTAVLLVLLVGLFVLNVYQLLTQRAALRIADILYIMSRNVRSKAAEVRRSQKDVEILEAHLFDIATSARSLLRALGRSESSLGPDPAVELTPNGKSLDGDSLLRLADNILYAVAEELPDAEWTHIVNRALDRFLEKVPKLDREGAARLLTSVARQYERDTDGRMAFHISPKGAKKNAIFEHQTAAKSQTAPSGE